MSRLKQIWTEAYYGSLDLGEDDEWSFCVELFYCATMAVTIVWCVAVAGWLAGGIAISKVGVVLWGLPSLAMMAVSAILLVLGWFRRCRIDRELANRLIADLEGKEDREVRDVCIGGVMLSPNDIIADLREQNNRGREMVRMYKNHLREN
jgi:hypothetical protein